MIMTHFIGSVDMDGISTEVSIGAKRGPADTNFQQYITRLSGIKKTMCYCSWLSYITLWRVAVDPINCLYIIFSMI